MGSGKISGIYVELRADPRQLKADLDNARGMVRSAAGNISDAMGGAAAPDKLSKSFNTLITDLSQLQRSSKAQAVSFKDIGFSAADLSARLELPEKQFAMLQQRMMQNQAAEAQISALKRIGQQAGLTKKEIQELGMQLGVSQGNINKATGTPSILSALIPATGVAAVLLALNQVKQGIVAVYDSGSKMERLNMSMSAITGSRSAAGETLAYLRNESDKAGVSFLETTDSYKSLLAAGSASGMAEKDIRSLFNAVTEAGTVVGMSQDQQSRSLLALQQMMSKGTVSSEELRQQLGESLPGAYALAAKAMGVTTAQFSKMLDQGQIVSKDFLPKFAKVLRDEFGANLEDVSNTGTTAANRLGSSWDTLKAKFYDSQGVVNALQNIKGVLDSLGGAAPALSGAVENPIEGLREKRAALQTELERWNGIADNWSNVAGAVGPSRKVEEIKKQIEAVNRELTNAEVATGKNVQDMSRPKDNKQKAADEAEYMKVSAEFAEKRLEAAEKLQAVEWDIRIARAQGQGGGEFDIKQMQEQKQHAQTMLGYQKELVRAKLDATIDSGEIGKSMGLENQRHAVAMANLSAEAKLTQADRQASMQTALNKLSDITGYYDSIKELRAKANVDNKSQDPVTQANAYIKRDAAIWQAERARVQSYAKDTLSLQAEMAANQATMANLNATYNPKEALSAQASAADIQGRQRDLDLTKQLADAKRDLARSKKEAATDSDPVLAAEIERQEAYIKLLERAKASNNETTAAKVADIKASREAATGMSKALKDYTDTATNAAANSKQMWSNSFSATEDALTSMVTSSKTSISSLFETIRAEIFRTQAVRPLLGALSSGLESGSLLKSAGSWIASIFHDGGTVGVTAAPMRAVPASTFVGAPRYHNGLQSGERAAILQDGEDVISRAQKAKLRNMAAVGGDGASMISMPVTINNNAGESVQATARQVQSAQGGPSLEISIDKIVAKKLGTPGSAVSKAMSSSFGVSRRVTTR